MGVWHRKTEETTNTASQERRDKRQVAKDIRVSDHQSVKNIRDWRDQRKRDGGIGHDD